jgi:hypothetical protein
MYSAHTLNGTPQGYDTSYHWRPSDRGASVQPKPLEWLAKVTWPVAGLIVAIAIAGFYPLVGGHGPSLATPQRATARGKLFCGWRCSAWRTIFELRCSAQKVRNWLCQRLYGSVFKRFHQNAKSHSGGRRWQKLLASQLPSWLLSLAAGSAKSKKRKGSK